MKQLHGKEWIEACDMWMSGRFTLEELSQKFGVTVSGLWRRFKRNGIEKGAHAELERRAISQAISERTKSNEDLLKVAVEVKELNLKGSVMITKRTLLEIKNANDSKTSLFTIDPNLKALERAARILNVNYSTACRILHLDQDDDGDEDGLPTLEVVRMTKKDIADLRAEQEAEMIELTGGSDDDLDIDEIAYEMP